MGFGSKFNAGMKAVKGWIAANKVSAGIIAGILVAGGTAAVALGAGALSEPVAAESTKESFEELSSEDLETAYVPNLLRGDRMGQPFLDALWASLEAEYATEPVTTEEETTEEETTKKEVVEIPPVVVAPVDDVEDEQPQDDADKGTSEEVDISDVINDDTKYENAGRSYGIDVSKWQGSIDWAQVAASGVEFAIIRVGYRGNQTGEIMMDPYFEKNIKGALANHIKVGVYFYSQAIDEEEAKVEAAWVVNVIQKYQITYPVVYDCEGLGQNRIKDVTKTQRSKNAAAFLDYIRSAGYTPMMYASKYGYLNNWDMSYIKNCKIWLAHYTSGGLNTPSDYSGTYHMWQYTSKGTVPGINGNVDLNVAYFTYSNTPDPVIGRVTYTVQDETGAPVKGAVVSMKGDITRRTLTAETDDNGNAVFTDVVVDDYEVKVSTLPEGYETGSASSADISFGKAEDSYSSVLQIKRAVCSGVSYQVVDQNGAAVSGVTVTLKGKSRIGSSDVELTAVSDSNGNAEFKDVLFGTYEVYVTAVPENYEMLASSAKESLEVTSSAAVIGKQKFTVTKKEEESSESETTEPTEPTSPSESAETENPTEPTVPSADPTESGISPTDPTESDLAPIGQTD